MDRDIEKITDKAEAYLQGFRDGQKEYTQFILNILDGIDDADRQMGNQFGGTAAIRLALKSRVIE